MSSKKNTNRIVAIYGIDATGRETGMYYAYLEGFIECCESYEDSDFMEYLGEPELVNRRDVKYFILTESYSSVFHINDLFFRSPSCSVIKEWIKHNPSELKDYDEVISILSIDHSHLYHYPHS